MDGTALQAIAGFVDDSKRGEQRVVLVLLENDLCCSHLSGSDIDDTRADL